MKWSKKETEVVAYAARSMYIHGWSRYQAQKKLLDHPKLKGRSEDSIRSKLVRESERLQPNFEGLFG